MNVELLSSVKSPKIKPCEPKDALEILLVDRNIESVIESIREKVIEGALDKNQLTRDGVFIQCGLNTTPESRMRLMDDLPDIKRLVAKIAECLNLKHN